MLIIFISTLIVAGYKTFLSLSHPVRFKNDIIYFAEKNMLSPTVVASVINVESSYKKNAMSNKKAIGLMQIKLDTANYLNDINNTEHISETQLFDAKTNIEYGCMYLSYLVEKFEDIYTSLAAYNAGETRVRSWLKSEEFSADGKTLIYIPYKETANYIEKIKKNIKFYQKIYKY